MDEFDQLLAANRAHAEARANVHDARPNRRLAVVTCMDCRIDVYSALGLHVGEAVVIRNAGARVTGDVLRSLALATHVLGVETVVLMEHTGCGVAGVSDEELQRITGAELRFHAITSHDHALRADVETLAGTVYLAGVRRIMGCVYDVGTGAIDDVVRWERPG